FKDLQLIVESLLKGKIIMKIKTLHMKYEENFEEFDERVNEFLQHVDEKQHWELVSVTPSVTNSIEGVDYFITVVYKK
ncbi:hypothetical protein, partial [Staphylococcus xylosus]